MKACLKKVNDVYVTDAYHSLSIEGYQVAPELIEGFAQAHGTPKGMNATVNSRTRWQHADTGWLSNQYSER